MYNIFKIKITNVNDLLLSYLYRITKKRHFVSLYILKNINSNS